MYDFQEECFVHSRTGSISRDSVSLKRNLKNECSEIIVGEIIIKSPYRPCRRAGRDFPSQLCRRRSCSFTEVARLVPPEIVIIIIAVIIKITIPTTTTTTTNNNNNKKNNNTNNNDNENDINNNISIYIYIYRD